MKRSLGSIDHGTGKLPATKHIAARTFMDGYEAILTVLAAQLRSYLGLHGLINLARSTLINRIMCPCRERQEGPPSIACNTRIIPSAPNTDPPSRAFPSLNMDSNLLSGGGGIRGRRMLPCMLLLQLKWKMTRNDGWKAFFASCWQPPL